jgi:serine beta-lactamase-like protein LACTB
VVDALKIFQDAPLVHPPGSAYSYSSYSFDLVSAVIEGPSGQSFPEYMRDAVFGPLGMCETLADFLTPIVPGRTSYYTRNDAGHVVNAPFVNDSYECAGGGFLSTFDGREVGYGFGWAIEHDDAGRSLLSHGGGSVGGTSLMIMQPDTGVIVVGLSDLTRANNGVVREVLRRFIDAAASTVH